MRKGYMALSSLLLPLLLTSAQLPSSEAVKPVEVLQVPSYSEGVTFDAEGNVYLSHGKSITRRKPDGTSEIWVETGAPDGHKVMADGSHLVCDDHGAVFHLDARGKVIRKLTEADGVPLNAPNDLTLDPKGGFYFTDSHTAEKPEGTVVYVDPQWHSHVVAGGLWYSNGIVLRPDGKTLLVGESKRNHILEYPVLSLGKLGKPKEFAALPTKGAGQIDNQPDGMCLDTEGNVYVAHYGMGRVQVLDPRGKLIRSYATGLLTTSNVAFGGPQMDQLYVTGAIGEEGKSAGGLHRLDLPGVRGLQILPGR
jgi:gluconolactonase